MEGGGGYLVKGINNQPNNLQALALEEKINELINEQTKMSPHEENLASSVPGVTAQTAVPTKLSLHYNDNAGLSDQNTASNTNDSFQQVPKNR